MRRNEIIVFLSAFACTLMWGLDVAKAQCVLPFQLTNGQTADASQVMSNLTTIANCLTNGAPAGSTNALQFNAGSGTLGGVGPLTNGQLVIGSTGGAPQANTLTAGTGIAISNAAGSVTIAATGAGSNTWPPFQPPLSANFPVVVGLLPAVTVIDDTQIGMSCTLNSNTNGFHVFGKVIPTPTHDWSATAFIRHTYNSNSGYAGMTIWNSGQTNGFTLSQDGYNYVVYRYAVSSGAFVNYAVSVGGLQLVNWMQISYVASSDTLTFSLSNDGKNFITLYTATATSLIGAAPDHVGFHIATRSGGLTAMAIPYYSDTVQYAGALFICEAYAVARTWLS